MSKNNITYTKNLTLIAVMTAVLCIICPFALPVGFGPVPFTLSTLGINLCVGILGTKRGTISCLLYIFLGAVGLPVFSGFSGGAGKLFGPTGGYIIGYIFLCLIAGAFIDRGNKWLPALTGIICGTVCCYLFGTIWLAYQMHLDFLSAASLGVLPYLPAEIIKIVLTLLIIFPLKRALHKANLL